ncbi:DNA/RNA non-specific endonuclease [Bifidobacterium longum]|uniref:DNA/RNA non-specific endonuclease n=1 Tax=Bifidobacterium longum TaxID=216816 RepID=UPI002024CFFD|nr:DNA/RNA non-specific endonuclease [Bifidobacterium longum]
MPIVEVRKDNPLYPADEGSFILKLEDSKMYPTTTSTCFDVAQRGQFYTDESGKLFKVCTHYGVKDKPNPDMQKEAYSAIPNVEFDIHPNSEQEGKGISFTHIFKTNSCGSVETVETPDVHFPSIKGHRQPFNDYQRTIMRELDHTDRGHLISSQLGGGMEDINLVPMTDASNRGHRPETMKKNGLSEFLDKSLQYNPRYPEGAHIPLKDTSTMQYDELNDITFFVSTNYREVERFIEEVCGNMKKNAPDDSLTLRWIITYQTLFLNDGQLAVSLYPTIFISLFVDKVKDRAIKNWLVFVS